MTAPIRPHLPPDTAQSNAPRKPTAARLRKIRTILGAAEQHFAQLGFEGASLESIANAAGLSRHNLLYYFPSKEALYLQVLDDVLTQWLQGMADLLHGDDPEVALRAYVAAKMASSRDRPEGAKVFAMEVMAGAPRFANVIRERVAPMLQRDTEVFETWVAQGKITRVDFTHFMFMLWSMTQAYAEQQTQFALLLGKPALDDQDFDTAAALISHLAIQGLRTPPTQAT